MVAASVASLFATSRLCRAVSQWREQNEEPWSKAITDWFNYVNIIYIYMLPPQDYLLWLARHIVKQCPVLGENLGGVPYIYI